MVSKLISNKVSLMYLLLFLFSVFVLFDFPADPDFGWHYKYGEYLFKNHEILRENIFSFNFPNYIWANSYWLSQLIIFILFNFWGGIVLSLVFSTLLSALILLIMSKIRVGFFGKALGVVLLAPLLSTYVVTVRPLFFSSIFLLILIYILNFRRNYARYLPLLFLVWANMHADFVLGLFVYGIYTLFELFRVCKSRAVDTRVIYLNVLTPVISVLITLVNPFGFGLWTTLLKEAHPYQFSQILEWASVSTYDPFFYYVSVSVFGLIASAAWIKRDSFGKWYLFVIALFFALSFRFSYFIRPLVLAGFLPVLFLWDEQAGMLMSVLESRIKSKLEISGRILLFFSCFVGLGAFIDTASVMGDIESWSKRYYPYDAVQYIRENSIEGRMFNAYSWGGYLIWQLPEYKTFVDGRMPSWREEKVSVFEDYINITNKPDEYADLLESYDVNFILEKKGVKLVEYLLKTNEWDKLYEDDLSVILVRKG